MKTIFLFLLGLCNISLLQAQTAEELLKLGNQQFNAQNYIDAKNTYLKAIQIDPKSPKAHHNLGNVYFIQSEYDKALFHFNKAIELSSKDAEPLNSRANLYLGLKKYKEALADLNQVIAQFPNNRVAYLLRGDLYWSINQKEKACQDWKQAHSLGHPQAAEKIKKNCQDLVNLPETRTIQTPKKLGKPSSASDYFKLGEHQLEIRDYEGAIQNFSKAIDLDGEYAEAYFGRGGAKFAKGDHEGACADWKKSLDLGYKKAKDMLTHGCN